MSQRTQKKIKELFSNLTVSERLILLKELNEDAAKQNYIGQLYEYCQKNFKQPIKKETTVLDSGLVSTSIIAPFGNYSAVGNNKKEAAELAAAIALEEQKQI